jgi:DNA-binding transcriptional MerR regulator
MHIGELARRTGLSVKTVRYYSDLGLVPAVERSRSGHRRYDPTAALRLDFVRALRELGLDLATIRLVLDRELDLSLVAARHADAIDAQIRVLRVQRAALRALSRREPTEEEVDRVNRVARATAEERRRIINQFLDNIFEGIPVDAQFEAGLRSVTADLPDDPTDEQVDAWVELAELVRDPSFVALLRAMGERSFGAPGAAPNVLPSGHDGARHAAAVVTERAGAALAEGIDPASPAAEPLLDAIVGELATGVGRADSPEYRRELLDQMDLAADPRPERYWQLLAIINGWRPFPNTSAHWGWLAAALRARGYGFNDQES